MPITTRNQIASLAGLCFPPGVIFPNNPGAGGIDAVEEYQQCVYLFASGDVSAPAPAPTPTPGDADAHTPGVGLLWHVPAGRKWATVRVRGVFPAPTLRAKVRVAKPETEVRVQGRFPAPTLTAYGILEPAPLPIGMAVRARFPGAVLRVRLRVESEEEELITLMMMHLVSR